MRQGKRSSKLSIVMVAQRFLLCHYYTVYYVYIRIDERKIEESVSEGGISSRLLLLPRI